MDRFFKRISEKSFIDQVGYQDEVPLGFGGVSDELDPLSLQYWNYTSANFADFNGDGLLDLFVGGFGEFRVALNEGTLRSPKFGLRKYLLGIDGKPLSVIKPTEEELSKARDSYVLPHFSGVIKSFVTPVDWDDDGVLDLLVTHLYTDKRAKDPIVFFRGVNTDKGLRFENAIPLFTAPDFSKTFPGCQPNVVVTDFNNDGVKDIVIGISIPTVNGYQVDSLTSWSFLKDLGIETPGKDAGRILSVTSSLDALIKKVEENPNLKSFYLGKLKDYKYLTLRHRGYVYVMLGAKNSKRAKLREKIDASDEIRKPENIKSVNLVANGPVAIKISSTGAVGFSESGILSVELNLQDNWHGYAENIENERAGWIPTKVDFTLPEGFEFDGDMNLPAISTKAGLEVYRGKILFSRRFRPSRDPSGKGARYGKQIAKAKVQYQTCNNELCLPPEEKNLEIEFKYGTF